MVRFRWDARKARANLEKHGISFAEAAEALATDFRAISDYDETHSVTEERWTTWARSSKRRILRVTTKDVGDTVWIISARRASVPEKKRYEQEPG